MPRSRFMPIKSPRWVAVFGAVVARLEPTDLSMRKIVEEAVNTADAAEVTMEEAGDSRGAEVVVAARTERARIATQARAYAAQLRKNVQEMGLSDDHLALGIELFATRVENDDFPPIEENEANDQAG